MDVMIRMVFLKSTVRPCESVIRPSSSTWSSTLNTSGCAFSISSNSTTLNMVYDEQPLSADRLLHILHIPEALRSDGIRNISPCTHSYRYVPYSVHHQTDVAASAFGKLCLTDTGRSEEQEGTDWLGRIFDSGFGTEDGICYQSYTFILSDDTFVQFIFQIQEVSFSHLQSVWLPGYRSIGK